MSPVYSDEDLLIFIADRQEKLFAAIGRIYTKFQYSDPGLSDVAHGLQFIEAEIVARSQEDPPKKGGDAH